MFVKYVYFVFIVLLFLISQHVFAKNKINNIVVFGDSMSDTGNFNKYINIIYFPPRDSYWQKHFSNGPVWVEYVAALFNNKDYIKKKPIGASYLLKYYNQVGVNLNQRSDKNAPFGFLKDRAVGGAMATNNYNLMGGLYHIPSLLSQVDNYFKESPTRVDEEIKHSLYVVEIGGNDYLHGLGDTQKIIFSVRLCIEKLIDRGAKYFLIPNLPELADAPEAKAVPSQLEFRKQQTKEHNQELKKLVNSFKKNYPEKIFIYADVHSYFDDILNHMGAIGKYGQTKNLIFSNDDYCNKTGLDISAIIHSSQLCKTTEQRKTTIFWDSVHPSTAVHCIIGKNIFSLLQDKIEHKKVQQNYNGCIDSLI